MTLLNPDKAGRDLEAMLALTVIADEATRMNLLSYSWRRSFLVPIHTKDLFICADENQLGV